MSFRGFALFSIVSVPTVGIGVYAINRGLDLLNTASDIGVLFGAVIVLVSAAATVEAVRYFWNTIRVVKGGSNEASQS